MKKGILKVFGVAALAAGMLYNVQVFDAENGSDISMAALGVMAVANNEGGGGGGHANLCDSIWKVTYSGSIGTSTGVTVTCESGGPYKCPICIG